MRFAVLGALGQLGRDLCPLLPGEVIPLSRADADLSCPGDARRLLERLKPDTVINCAAYNLVDRAESDPAAAFAVNAHAVRELALACRDLGCLLVHFSTDHVFGLDENRKPWRETDAPGPVSVYGASKLAGEHLVRAVCPRHLLIRTCGLYGRHGSGGKGGNFVETMLRLASQGKPLRVVNDQVCTPSSTVDVAVGTVALIEKGRTGLYHLTCDGACSWFEFARTIFDLAGVAAEMRPISSAEYGAAARRPAYSVLDTAKYQELGRPPLRSWREALADYLERRATAMAA